MLEAADLLGGTTALSGDQLWIPNSGPMNEPASFHSCLEVGAADEGALGVCPYEDAPWGILGPSTPGLPPNLPDLLTHAARARRRAEATHREHTQILFAQVARQARLALLLVSAALCMVELRGLEPLTFSLRRWRQARTPALMSVISVGRSSRFTECVEPVELPGRY